MGSKLIKNKYKVYMIFIVLIEIKDKPQAKIVIFGSNFLALVLFFCIPKTANSILFKENHNFY
jgi:hypothetical protein